MVIQIPLEKGESHATELKEFLRLKHHTLRIGRVDVDHDIVVTGGFQ